MLRSGELTETNKIVFKISIKGGGFWQSRVQDVHPFATSAALTTLFYGTFTLFYSDSDKASDSDNITVHSYGHPHTVSLVCRFSALYQVKVETEVFFQEESEWLV